MRKKTKTLTEKVSAEGINFRQRLDIDELLELNELNELDILYKLIELTNSLTSDMEKVVRGVKVSGLRIRHRLQDVILLSEVIRDKIQIRRGADWGKKRVFVLDKAIKKENERIKKEIEAAELKRKERISKIYDIENGEKG